jgi:hypothetical protein
MRIFAEAPGCAITSRLVPEPAHTMVKPVFLIRDPVRVFDSWKSVGWMDMDSIVDCFKNLFHIQSEPHEEPCRLVYEKLVQNKYGEIERVCKHWGVAFNPDMLEFKQEFGSFIFNNEREKRIYQEKKSLELFKTVEAHSTVKADIPSHGLLSNDEKYEIETKLGMMYLSC